MIFSEIKANSLSRLGQAGAIFSIGAFKLKESGMDIKLITADYGNPSGMQRFQKNYPNDFINVGIAEQNLIGIASGISDSNAIGIAGAQACFVSMRSYEQVRQFMGYMKIPLILVGVSSGFSLTYFGNTHYSIEDYGIISAIPGIDIFTPSDGLSAIKALESSINNRTPTYIRTTGTPIQKPIYHNYNEIDENYNILSSGNDILIISSGSVTREALIASQSINEQGISTMHIDLLKAKPIEKKLEEIIMNFSTIFVIEEHSDLNSIGSHLALSTKKEVIRINTGNKFHEVGDYDFLLSQNNLKSEKIESIIIKEFA